MVMKKAATFFCVSIWKTSWPLWIGAVGLALTNIFMFAYARAIGVFPQMAMWGSWLYHLTGITVDAPFVQYPRTPIYLDTHSMINLGLLLGVAIAALLSREFKVRTEDWRGYAVAMTGGILMGFGTVIMPPCNVGGFYSATMALSLSGPVAALGLIPGAYLGGLLLKRKVIKAAEDIDFDSLPQGKPAIKKPLSHQPTIGLLISLLLATTVLIYTYHGKSQCAGLLLFGALFGIIFQRSRLCFCSAFREIFVSRDSTVMKWTLLSMAIGTFGFSILKSQGYQPMHFVLPVGLHTVVGGFIFGLGMVLAGGCGVGILWRSAEGYVRAWIALIAGMLASAAWVPIYGGHVGEGKLYGKPFSLGEQFGWFNGTVIVLLFLAAFYILLYRVEAKKK